jgi:hypothetical protein
MAAGLNRQQALDIFKKICYNIKKEIFYGSGIKRKLVKLKLDQS